MASDVVNVVVERDNPLPPPKDLKATKMSSTSSRQLGRTRRQMCLSGKLSLCEVKRMARSKVLRAQASGLK